MNREEYPRVTEILDKYSNMQFIEPQVLSRAQIRGTEVDIACKMLMDGLDPFQIDDEYQGYIDSFMPWKENKEFVPNPGRMYCDTLTFTGESDGIYRSERGLILFDIKTSTAESKTWPLQGAAYVYLAKLIGFDIQGIEFIKLSKEGKAPKVYTYEYSPNWDLFKKCLDLYQYFNGKKSKKTAMGA